MVEKNREITIVILILDLLKDCGTINDNDYEILYKAIEWISLNDITVQKSSSVTIAWFFLLYSILDYWSSA